MTKEESNLNFLTIHLKPHLWSWKDQEMNRQSLYDIDKTKTAMEEYEEGKIKNKKGYNIEGTDTKKLATIGNYLGHISGGGSHHCSQKAEEISFQGHSLGGVDTSSNGNTRYIDCKDTVTDLLITKQKKPIRLKGFCKAKKTIEELLKDELFNIIADLKTGGGYPGHILDMKIPAVKLKRVIELEKSMDQAGWNRTWSKVRASLEAITWRYWEKSIKAQIQQIKLVEGWKVTKKGASDDLRHCMKLLKAEEYWPVFSRIEYKTFTNTMNLIRKMHSKNNGQDYKELCRLIPPKILNSRLSRMEYMAQHPDIISHLYSDDELRSKQENGYDTLMIMMIEEALEMATQLELEISPYKSKNRKAWEVFARFYRVMRGEMYKGDEVDDTRLTVQKKHMSTYWPTSIECELFTFGSTPQSQRFKNGFQIALKNLQEIDYIHQEAIKDISFVKLMEMAGSWSLSDILLGIHNGVDLKTLQAYSHFANSYHNPYVQAAPRLEKKQLEVKQVYNFQRFLQACMELQKEIEPSSYRPLNTLRVQ
ncbi:hypothetical protein DFH28DRAFT_1148542 [Melampsora americana]|nr:hypothetical protein DFH28DRAFT_1148542 [Melampsora americana]